MMEKRIPSIKKLVLASLFLALGQVLPLFTTQIPEANLMMLPAYIPIFFCGYICGWSNGLIVGLITPIMQSILFGMPLMLSYAVAMSFEFAAYGFLTGILYRLLPKKRLFVYITMILASIAGKLIWEIVFMPLSGITFSFFAWITVMSGVFFFTIVNIVVQILLIPFVIMALKRTKIMP